MVLINPSKHEKHFTKGFYIFYFYFTSCHPMPARERRDAAAPLAGDDGGTLFHVLVCVAGLLHIWSRTQK